jgi:hypothetical protein
MGSLATDQAGILTRCHAVLAALRLLNARA